MARHRQPPAFVGEVLLYALPNPVHSRPPDPPGGVYFHPHQRLPRQLLRGYQISLLRGPFQIVVQVRVRGPQVAEVVTRRPEDRADEAIRPVAQNPTGDRRTYPSNAT